MSFNVVDNTMISNSIQMLMNVLKVCLDAARSAQTQLEVLPVRVVMVTLWMMMESHARVCTVWRLNFEGLKFRESSPIHQIHSVKLFSLN